MKYHRMLTYIVILGEIANFAAYAFAPAILVTPLGALSVLIGCDPYKHITVEPGRLIYGKGQYLEPIFLTNGWVYWAS